MSFLSYLSPAAFRRTPIPEAPSDASGDDHDPSDDDSDQEPPGGSGVSPAELFPDEDNNDKPAGDIPLADTESLGGDEKHNEVQSENEISVPNSLMIQILDLISQEKKRNVAVVSAPDDNDEIVGNRGRLPKIVYSKLVTLSLTNFPEYKESIRVLGFARKWPTKYANPSLEELQRWEGRDKDSREDDVRREAFLVLYQLIPLTLRYLIVDVQEGDVVGIWIKLYARFMQITHASLKKLKGEWEAIRQGSMPVDEFISHVSRKAKELRMVGIKVSVQEEATALLTGLNEHFGYIKRYFNLRNSYTITEVSQAALTFAVDEKLFTSSPKTPKGSTPSKSPCIKFNEGHCRRREDCRYAHVKISEKELRRLKKDLATKPLKNSKTESKALTVQKVLKCFKCQQPGHVVRNCPNSARVDEFCRSIGQGAVPVIEEGQPVVMPCFLTKGVNSCSWVLDSGASQHITNRREWLQSANPVPENSVSFTVGNDEPMVPTHVGNVLIGNVLLTQVYYCARCPINLMSEARLLLCGADVVKTSKDGKAVVRKGEKNLFHGVMVKNLFVVQHAYDGKGKLLNVNTVYSGEEVFTPMLGVAFNGSKLMDFHRKWGHLNFKECLNELKMDTGTVKEMVCPECELTKSRRKPAPNEASTRADQPLYRLHADLSGRKLATLQGYRYYLVVVDDCSRYRWVRMLHSKSKADQEVMNLIEAVEREKAPSKVSIFRTDGGGEFVNERLKEFLVKRGIKHEKSAPHSQFQNGVAERTVGILDESARAMMLQASSPTYDWCHAVNHAAYCRNRLPTKALDGAVPIEVYNGVQRKLRDPMPIFGCLGYAKQFVRGKLEPKAKRVVFLSSSDEYKADHVRDVSSFSSSLREFYTRDVKYDNRIFPYKSRLVPRPVVPPMDEEDVKEALKIEEALKRQRQLDEVEVLDVEVDEKGEAVWEVERIIDKRVSRFGPRHLPIAERGWDYKVVWKPEGVYPDSWEPEANLEASEDAIRAYEESVSEAEEKGPVGRRSERIRQQALTLWDKDPATREEAMASPQREEWLAAEAEELKSIHERNVWTLVDPEPGMNILGSRFVYKLKRKPDGTIERFKVRLVAQGFKQKEGVDFSEVFATTVAWQAVRIVLWLATFYKLFMAKVDIKTFFLYGELREVIYMQQPPGYRQGNKICRLTKTLYGLKQSMRCALEALAKALKEQNIIALMSDANVFFRKDERGVVIICAWVDDLLCCCSNYPLFEDFVQKLRKFFELTVDKQPTDYLQMQLVRDQASKKLKLHQEGYVLRLLTKFRMQDCNAQKVPMSKDDLPHPSELCPSEEKPYMELVGSLIWLLRTRLDLMVAVNILTRYMHRYDDRVWQTALKVLKYLKGCPDHGIVYDLESSNDCEYGDGVVVSFEVDSNWGGSGYDSKSTTGWLVKFNDTVVGCQTKNQTRPAVSTAEAELNGLEFVGKEVEWVGDFLFELGIKAPRPFRVAQDNAAALALTRDPVMRPRTKYFRIAQHYVKWLQTVGKAEYYHVKGKQLVADFLTKPLSHPDFVRHKRVLMGEQGSLKQVTGCCLLIHQRVQTRSAAQRLQRGTVFWLAERRLSYSDHYPSLIAECPRCRRYLKWLPRQQNWEDCEYCDDPRCYCCNRSVCITCTECHGVAWFHRRLRQYLCYHCNAAPGVVTRSRNRV